VHRLRTDVISDRSNVVLTNSPSISRKRLPTRSISIAHDQNIINAIRTRAEGILENSAGSQDDFTVISGCLAGGRSVKVPSGEVLNGSGALHWQGAGFGTGVSGGIDPYVFG
jgi:hypothetical protein